ncbi:MAG: DUF3575 domain-containing protein [Rikenellaceae bacterium]|nr:DUF3575 domain-containing protein [Rikenellaceae bacterium]
MAVLCLVVSYRVTAQTTCDSVKIYFRQAYSTLDLSIRNNREALDRIADSLEGGYADSIYQLRRIVVIGGASPEGSVPLNIRLSEKRADRLFGYLSKYGDLPDSLKEVRHLGRDWQGLLALVEADPKVPYREQTIEFLKEIIARSVNGEREADNNVGRLSRFMGGEPYRYMYRHLFPELRASRLILWYDRIWNPRKVQPLELSAPLSVDLKMQPTSLNPLPVTPVPNKPFYMAVKSNLLYDAALVPNVGVEFYLGANLSVAANWMYAWWTHRSNDWFWRIYGGDVALRWWFGRAAKEKPLTGHHVGPYLQTLTYDFETGGRGYIGGVPGGDIFDKANCAAGIEYGYSLPIGRRLNLDFTIGLGYLWGTYYEYLPQDGCYVWQATKKRQFFGPTKAEVSLVWLIGRGNVNREKGGKR